MAEIGVRRERLDLWGLVVQRALGGREKGGRLKCLDIVNSVASV